MNEVFFLEEFFLLRQQSFAQWSHVKFSAVSITYFLFLRIRRKTLLKFLYVWPIFIFCTLYIYPGIYRSLPGTFFYHDSTDCNLLVGRLIQIWANQFKKKTTELLVCLTKTKKMLGLFSVRIFCIIWANFCCCGIHLTLSVHECRVSDSVRQKRNLLHQVSKIIGLGMIGSSIVSSRVRLPPSCQILYKKYFLKLKAKNGTS